MIAKLLGKILFSIGVVETGVLVEAKRADLVGSVIGDTAQKTQTKIEDAKGGVLFVDEAYQLTRVGGKDFGIEAVETIMNAMLDDDPLFVFAGYPEDMGVFLEANAGLKRRIGRRFEFPDYSTAEIATIFINYKVPPYKLEDGFDVDAVREVIEEWTTPEQRAQFNAGLADGLLSHTMQLQNRRVTPLVDQLNREGRIAERNEVLMLFTRTDVCDGMCKFAETSFTKG